MKNKKLLGVLGVAALLLAGNFAWQEKEVVEAATPTTKWAAIGEIGGSGWSKDLSFTYDEVDQRFELTLNMNANQQFKLRYNGSWNKQMSYDSNFNNNSNIPTYLKDGGGNDHNFVVKETGNYTLCLDKGVESYTYGYTWALSIVKNEEKQNVEISYYDGSQKLETVIAKEGDTFFPSFFEKEGFALEGWYTKDDLTNKFVSGTTLSSSLNLYAKYIQTSDYTIYLEDTANLLKKANAYMWADSYENHNNTWPGASMTPVEGRTGLYSITVDASKSYDKIIFNNGTLQTVNLELTGVQDGDTFILGTTQDSEGHYNAEVNATSVTSLFDSYYNEGSYTKVSDIFVNEEVGHDISQYFHTGNIAELHRTTVYSDGRLLMTTEKDTNGVGYKTVGEDMVRFHVVNGQDVNDFTVKGTSVEAYYVTLADFLLSSSTSHYGTLDMLSGWTYADGIYSNSSEDVLDAFRLFTAPMWVGKTAETENYIIFSKATVEVVDGDLVMKLWAVGEEGKLTNTDGLFSQAVISLN